MYKINHKAVLLVFLVQILIGFGWYSAAPISLIDNSQGVPKLPSIDYLLSFCFASLIYLYFTAWLLVKVKQLSVFSMMVLILGMWFCVVLPNYIFMSVYLHFDIFSALYLLAYGVISSVLAAIILPLWRASRSIFKG